MCAAGKRAPVSENQDLRSDETTAFDHAQPIPAARPLRDFSWERVDQDLVLFDRDSMHYHTLNAVAEQVWRSCDGVATIKTISMSTSLPVDVIETTIGELGEASLLRTPASAWSVPMSRRRAAKLLGVHANTLTRLLAQMETEQPGSSTAWRKGSNPRRPAKPR